MEVPIFGKKFTALAAAVILIVVGYYIAQQKMEPKPIPEEAPQEISSPSDAIPSVEGVSAYMLMEVDDTRSLYSVLSFLPGFVEKCQFGGSRTSSTTYPTGW